MKQEPTSRGFGLAALCFFAAMAIFPGSIYAGARRGLDLWAGVLVPSMLPFFILAEILMASGILRLLGRFLSPVMGPLFYLPGPAGLGLALGYTSGFPMGAAITSRLYKEGYLKQEEAGRLLAFTNNSSPGFLLTSLAAGMLANPAVGPLLALCHYGANLLFGMALGLWSRLKSSRPPAFGARSGLASTAENRPISSPAEALTPAPSLSRVVSESITAAIQSILTLGGYVLLFSAFLQLLEDIYLLDRLALLIRPFLSPTLAMAPLAQALTAGFFEMTLGLSRLTTLALPLPNMLTYCLVLLGWSGLSIQAQVAGLAGNAHVPLGFYFLGCILQPILSLLLFSLCLGLLGL